MTELAKRRRKATHGSRAQARRAKTQRRQAAALKAWNQSELPDWLTEKFYREKVRPHLVGITVPTIASALGLSQPYAAKTRAGRKRPHPRHWKTLARIAGDLSDDYGR